MMKEQGELALTPEQVYPVAWAILENVARHSKNLWSSKELVELMTTCLLSAMCAGADVALLKSATSVEDGRK